MGILCLLLLCKPYRAEWGFHAHEQINYLAVFTLPKGLFGFYKANLEQIREKAGNADRRRGILPEEAMRHFLDVDRYEYTLPLDTIRLSWDSACARFGQEQLEEHGIAPWFILRLKWALTRAFERKDLYEIVKLSADLGHYIGDIHVPLHAHSNYDGQQTGQHGIHALWESRLPELFMKEYRLLSGSATYLENPAVQVWQAIGESYQLTGQVLEAERSVRESLGDTKSFTTDMRNGKPFRTYSLTFRKRYHQMLDGMVERRMLQAIWLTGCIWYSAWVDAGQPHLPMELAGPDEMSADTLASPLIKRIFKRSCENDEL